MEWVASSSQFTLSAGSLQISSHSHVSPWHFLQLPFIHYKWVGQGHSGACRASTTSKGFKKSESSADLDPPWTQPFPWIRPKLSEKVHFLYPAWCYSLVALKLEINWIKLVIHMQKYAYALNIICALWVFVYMYTCICIMSKCCVCVHIQREGSLERATLVQTSGDHRTGSPGPCNVTLVLLHYIIYLTSS